MPQLFSTRATTLVRVCLTLAVVGAGGAAALALAWARAPSTWNVGVPASQPIPFRHDLHSGRIGIDCRYCHASVETAAYAGMPTTGTCLTCHAQVWSGASVLEPLRTSAGEDRAIRWTSVSRLPDWSYFHHAVHVKAGAACQTCHGRVDQMPEIVRAETLSMGFCLDCHRDPVPRLRPASTVSASGTGPHERGLPEELRVFYREASRRLTECSSCHR